MSIPSGGNEAGFAEEALSLLRSSVAAVSSKNGKKVPKPAGKAFQTSHDCSGWDRKARWQRAFNLAREKMGVDSADDSGDKWGAGGMDSDLGLAGPGDRRGGSAQPAMRASTGPGGAGLPGCAAGTIAELRTPVALKEHLKRGKGAREAGLQLATLEGGGLEAPLAVSEEDAAAFVAHFDQRRQMLGAPTAAGRLPLRPADRALRAWTNNNNGNNYLTTAITTTTTSISGPSNNNDNNVNSGVPNNNDNVNSGVPNNSCSSSNSCSGRGSSAGTGSGRSSITASTAAASGYSYPSSGSNNSTPGGSNSGSCCCSNNTGGSNISEGGGGGTAIAPVITSPTLGGLSSGSSPVGDGAEPASPDAAATATDGGVARVLAAASGTSSSGSFTGGGGGPMLHRRFSESGSASADHGAALPSIRRNAAAVAAAASDSIVVRLPNRPQRWESGSLQRHPPDPPVPPRSLEWQTACAGGGGDGEPAAAEVPQPQPAGPAAVPTRGSLSRQSSGALLPSSLGPGAEQHAGGWAGGGSGGADASCSGGGTLRPSPRPASAGLWTAPPPSLLSIGSAVTAATTALIVPSYGHTDAGSAAAAGAPSPFASPLASVSAVAQAHRQPTLPTLQLPPSPVPSLSGPERSCSPRLLASRVLPASAVAGGSGEIELDGARRMASPSANGAPSTSPGMLLPAASAAPVGSGGGVLSPMMPAPPASSPDSASGLSAAGPRRPRQRMSVTSDGAAVSGIGGGATGSHPLPLLQYSGWPTGDGNGLVIINGAAAPPPPPSSRFILQTSSASHSPTRPLGGAAGLHRTTHNNRTSSPGFSSVLSPATVLTPAPPPSSPPLTLRPHAPIHALTAATTPNAPSPPPASPTGAAYRRASMPTSNQILVVNGAAAAAAAAGGGHSVLAGGSPPQCHSVPQPSTSALPLRQTVFKSTNPVAATAAARSMPVIDAVLAGLREVETEVADELHREAEVAALTRHLAAAVAGAQRQMRMRASDNGGGGINGGGGGRGGSARAHHISMPGDPWRKWG